MKKTGRRRGGISEYSLQLREKQKIRRTYGVMERQFRNYFHKAARTHGITGENLLVMLETRLDNVVYRLGFAPSRKAARQLVRHNHVIINDKKVNIPSCSISEGDIIAVREKSKKLDCIHNSLKSAAQLPAWLEVDKVKLRGSVVRIPDREQIALDVNERLVVELYSK
jgi:small subunit ribosomal protein S4